MERSTDLVKFEVGSMYWHDYPDDKVTTVPYVIVTRTAKMVTAMCLIDESYVTRKIHIDSGAEYIFPEGASQMDPILNAMNEYHGS